MEVGYNGMLSIENEDPILSGEVGVQRSLAVLKNVREEILDEPAEPRICCWGLSKPPLAFGTAGARRKGGWDTRRSGMTTLLQNAVLSGPVPK